MSTFASVARSLVLLSTLAVLSETGCRSAPTKIGPPAPDLPARVRWVSAYRAARAASGAEACRLFTALSREPDAPVPELVHLRTDEACGHYVFPVDRAQLSPYLRELGLDVALKLAIAEKDRAAEMDLSAEVARRKLPQRERIALVKLALKRARELNLPAKVAAFTAQLYLVAPRLNPAPKPGEFLSVAGDFRQAREFAHARRFYERVISGEFSPDEKVSALKGLRLAFKNARQPEEHLKAAHRLSGYLTRLRALTGKSTRLRTAAFDALAYEGRAVWTAGRPAEANAVFAKMELQLRGKHPLADLYWLRARLAEETHAYADVTRYLDLALAEKPGDALKDKIFWYAAWNERARGNAEGAIAKMREIDQSTKDDPTRARALYWLGHTLRETDQTREADQIFERLITLDPVGYYGLLAHRQLGRAIRLKSTPASRRFERAPTLNADLADWLVAFDEKDALAALLDQASSAYLAEREQSDEAWTDLLQNYARAGLYLKLFEGLNTLPPERRRSLLDAHPDLLFPRPWPEITGAAAAKAGIDDALIYAIMRQESAFDPLARSGADAFGLMQLLPEVAERLAKPNDVPYRRPEDLFEPSTVIPLGAAFLRELSDRYRGQLIVLTAAYNASDAAIAGWMRQRYRGDALTFIEEIPYEETRTYVRLVMRNFVFYQLTKAGGVGLRFPESLLKLDAPNTGIKSVSKE